MALIKNFSRGTPIVPYGPMSEVQKRAVWNHARQIIGQKNFDKFWQQTTQEAYMLIRKMKEDGYTFSDIRSWQVDPCDYGDFCLIYPINFKPTLLTSEENRVSPVGKIELWKTGGFDTYPVSVNFNLSPDNSTTEPMLKFTNYLVENNVPFKVINLNRSLETRLI